MSYSKESPTSCAAATRSIAHHIRSNKLRTTSGTNCSPKSKTPVKISRNLFEFAGRRQSIRQWAAEYGLSRACIQSRLRYGIPLDQPKSRAGRPAFASAKEVSK